MVGLSKTCLDVASHAFGQLVEVWILLLSINELSGQSIYCSMKAVETMQPRQYCIFVFLIVTRHNFRLELLVVWILALWKYMFITNVELWTCLFVSPSKARACTSPASDIQESTRKQIRGTLPHSLLFRPSWLPHSFPNR